VNVVSSYLFHWLIDMRVVVSQALQLHAHFVITVLFKNDIVQVLGPNTKAMNVLKAKVVVHAFALVNHVMITDQLVSLLFSPDFVWPARVVCVDGNCN
jgi:hypothetical protein